DKENGLKHDYNGNEKPDILTFVQTGHFNFRLTVKRTALRGNAFGAILRPIVRQEKIGRAVGAFFSGVWTFIAAEIIVWIVSTGLQSSLRHGAMYYGTAGYYLSTVATSLIASSLAAGLASFVATLRFWGLGFTWGAIYGSFASGVVGLSTSSGFYGRAPWSLSWIHILAIVPLACAIGIGLWVERRFAGDAVPGHQDGESGAVDADTQARLSSIEERLSGLESLPQRLGNLEARLREISQGTQQAQTASENPQPAAPPVRVALRARAPAPAVAAPAEEFSWDDILEGRWLFRVGMAIFVLGVSFFLKYAFENQWIGPIGRVLMGFIAGTFFIALGDAQQKKGAALYGQTLIGGGLGILYLSIFAAFHFYGFLDQFPAGGAMALVTATAAVMAIRYSSISIIIVAMAGGFATPALLSTGVVHEIPLFSYLAILDAGVLAVSAFKDWRRVNLLAFALTQIWLQSYFSEYYHPDKLSRLFSSRRFSSRTGGSTSWSG
ncbi:MAG: DUF2339 domain-containing protein, partial [Elusimicrobia bacterium]|nr:DUF2339 domain-containing protein [Elusimicrobiota bacterium]